MKAYVKQPLPGDTLHTQSDDALKFLIKTYKELMADRDDPSYISCVQNRVDNIYKILGYRCAIEYLEKYGD